MSSRHSRLDQALHNGQVRRTISRRQNILRLTRKGRNRLDGIAADWTAEDDDIAAALGDDAAAFLEQARCLRNALGGIVLGRCNVRD